MKINQIAYTVILRAGLEDDQPADFDFYSRSFWTEQEAMALLDAQPRPQDFTVAMEIVADVETRRAHVLRCLSSIERLLLTDNSAKRAASRG